jgi:predicted PurR-regulated permease PerM
MALRSESLKDNALRTWISFLVVAGSSLVLLFLYTIRSVLLLLIIALILSIALHPLMRRLMHHRIKRVAAAIIALSITILILLGIIGAIASPLVTQGGSLITNAPALIDSATTNPAYKQLDKKFGFIRSVKEYAKQAPELLSKHSNSLVGFVGSAFSAASDLAVIFVMVLFMLIEGPSLWVLFVQLLSKQHGRFVDSVAQKIIIAIGGFVNGNLFISVIAGVVTLITLLIVGVPYAFALAALVAVFDLIPLIGASIATIVVALVSLSQGVVATLIVIAILLTYQFVEGNLIQPVVYGKSVRLSQLLIVIATVVGGLLGGIVGVLLAIPIAAACQIIIVEILRANGNPVDVPVSSEA